MNADVLTTSVENAIAVITLEIARCLASRPPEAVGYIKQLVRTRRRHRWHRR